MKKNVIAWSLFLILGALATVAYAAETWSITEGVNNEWVGQWTRQGDSNKFDCWQKSSTGSTLTATIIVSESGNTVSAQKINSSDGNNCNYSGIRKGNSVEGTYFCKNGGPYNWFAHISHL
jgi:hypothetical protein